MSFSITGKDKNNNVVSYDDTELAKFRLYAGYKQAGAAAILYSEVTIMNKVDNKLVYNLGFTKSGTYELFGTYEERKITC
jgi:hypothetical protein